jgi:predicted RNA-binding Zn-ribbon protein involved in translation (DUF1610 family)
VRAAQPQTRPRTQRAERRCPACGQPLYGWIVASARDRELRTSFVVDRCEECGLGVTRGVADPEQLLARVGARLARAGTLEIRAPNRDSWQAGIGGAQWAALELPDQGLHLTPRALPLLLDRHGLEAVRVHQPTLGRNQVWMWQTLLNGFTFHTNFALDVLRRRLSPRTARGLPSFAIDAIVSVLVALPVALVSVPLELLACLARRGGQLVITLAPSAPASKLA